MRRPILLALVVCLFALSSTETSYAHLTGGQTKIVSDYRVQFDTQPFHPTSRNNTLLMFSIRDLDWFHSRNITASISIIKDGVVMHTYPKQLYAYGDFTQWYKFERDGSHKILLEIHDSRYSEPLRAEFDVTVYEETFVSLIENVVMPVSFLVLLGIFGFLVPYLAVRKLWR